VGRFTEWTFHDEISTLNKHANQVSESIEQHIPNEMRATEYGLLASKLLFSDIGFPLFSNWTPLPVIKTFETDYAAELLQGHSNVPVEIVS